jgi:HPt (histidine-containing phosphotransfer) domain-containing protein
MVVKHNAIAAISSIIEHNSIMTSNSGAIFDATILSPLVEGDEALFRNIIDDFLAAAQSYISELAAADSATIWTERAHKLKGAAHSVGALALADLAHSAETLAGRPELWPRTLNTLSTALDDLTALFTPVA